MFPILLPTRENIDEDIVCPADMPINSRKAFLQQKIENLPEKVKNRVTAMKHLQMQQIKLSERFFRDIYALEKSYYEQTKDLFDLRRRIITGQHEPPKQTKQWRDAQDDVLELIKNSPEFLELVQTMKRLPTDVLGVPNFWLNVFRSVSQLSDIVKEHDEPLLQSLVDIRIHYERDAYTFAFHFSPNDYLLTPVLTKKYYLRNKADEYNPFGFEGPEIYKCEGCAVSWRQGKNLTVLPAESTKKTSKRSTSKLRTQPRDSFFRFFTPPAAVELCMCDEKTRAALTADFEIGYLLRTQIIPKAVLFYTGDVVDGPSEQDLELESVDGGDKTGKDVNNADVATTSAGACGGGGVGNFESGVVALNTDALGLKTDAAVGLKTDALGFETDAVALNTDVAVGLKTDAAVGLKTGAVALKTDAVVHKSDAVALKTGAIGLKTGVGAAAAAAALENSTAKSEGSAKKSGTKQGTSAKRITKKKKSSN